MFATTITSKLAAKAIAFKSASALSPVTAAKSVHGVIPTISLAMAKRSLATISPDIMFPPSQQPKNAHPPTASVPRFPESLSRTVPSSSTEPPQLPATLRLKNGQQFDAISFGAPLESPISGEVVFTTSLVGYPESMTDPSYRGQILVFTQPLIGNYGVPSADVDQWGLLKNFESDKIQVKAIVVNDYATKYSHWNAVESLGQWCARNGVAALTGVDTRAMVTLLREGGSTLGNIQINGKNEPLNEEPLEDPNARNLADEVSVKSKQIYNPGAPLKVALIDCGVKQNIIRCLASRGVEVHVVPWDHDLTKDAQKYDGVFISNGPGDPRMLNNAVINLRKFMAKPAVVPTPIFGICMGNQLLGLAAGFNVYKLPYGNRGHNQPAIDLTTGKCVITSQNHGYAINDAETIPGWVPYFRNANDGSNEGIRHVELPYSSVQFHPEAKGGPMDTEYLFTDFVETVKKYKSLKNARAFKVASTGRTTSVPLTA